MVCVSKGVRESKREREGGRREGKKLDNGRCVYESRRIVG